MIDLFFWISYIGGVIVIGFILYCFGTVLDMLNGIV